MTEILRLLTFAKDLLSLSLSLFLPKVNSAEDVRALVCFPNIGELLIFYPSRINLGRKKKVNPAIEIKYSSKDRG